MTDPEKLIKAAQAAFAAAAQPAALENEKARFLGKGGQLTELLKGLARLPTEEKRTQGARINAAKERIEALLEHRRGELAEAELNARLAQEAIDVTLPGRRRSAGGIHPVIRTWQRIEEIFGSIGFDLVPGAEEGARGAAEAEGHPGQGGQVPSADRRERLPDQDAEAAGIPG